MGEQHGAAVRGPGIRIEVPVSGIEPVEPQRPVRLGEVRGLPVGEHDRPVAQDVLECDDSVVTAERLQELGYTNVRHYAGGKDEWKRLGLPLERAGKPYVP